MTEVAPRVRLTNLERVLWPGTGFTKGDLVAYYRDVAPALLPHVAGRPVMLARFPGGVEERGFAQNECRGRPDWLRTYELRLADGGVRHCCALDDVDALLWVANLGTIELHPYLALAARPGEPTAVVFDLDPEPPAGLAECSAVALALRAELERARLVALAKTSGGAGLHVVVPLNVPHRFDETKAFARSVAERLAAELPELVADRPTRRAARAGKVFVDWVQNDPTRSTAAVYSLRATRVPSVSTPLAWDELEAGAAPRFAPADALARVERLGDLFAPVLELRQRLPA